MFSVIFLLAFVVLMMLTNVQMFIFLVILILILILSSWSLQGHITHLIFDKCLKSVMNKDCI